MEFIPDLLPPGLPAWVAITIIIASFLAAALTAAFGIGGGLALLAIMSTILPAAAVIPVHGAAQLASNGGRFFIQRMSVVWPIVLWFTVGALIGAVIGGRLAMAAPVWLVRGGVGAFILVSVWGPQLRSFKAGPATFFSTGVIATFLTMFFGATGPIVATMVSMAKLDRLNLVATHAACMVFQHGFKVIAFGALGFAFSAWAFVIAAIVIAGLTGAAVGTGFLRRMPEAIFKRGFKYILTVIAFYLITAALIDLKTG